MTLEEQIREAAKKGLVSLTLYAEWSNDRTKVYWTCRATPTARHGYVGVEHAVDPVEAVSECLKALPSAKLRGPNKKPLPPSASEAEVTAAVTENDPGTPRPSFDEWMKS